MLVGEILGEDPHHVDVGMLGIADVLLAHHVGDAGGLGLEMEALDAERRELLQVEARQDVEHDQHGDARAVRRALPGVVVLVVGADRHRWSRWCGRRNRPACAARRCRAGSRPCLPRSRPCRRRRGPWLAMARSVLPSSGWWMTSPAHRRPCRRAADSARCWCPSSASRTGSSSRRRCGARRHSPLPPP